MHISGHKLYFLGQRSGRSLTHINGSSIRDDTLVSSHPTEHATLRIGATVGVPAVLTALGHDPVRVLAELGLDSDLFDDPDNRISFVERGRVMQHCADRTGCPHFGLLVGQHAGLDAFGFVGLLTRYSPDVGTALKSLTGFMHLHVRGATTAVSVEAGLATLEYQIYLPGAPGNQQVGDGAVAVAFNILNELCGADWKPVEVRFAHQKPELQEPYKQFFQAPLRFDTEQYAVVFPAHWLKHQLPEASPELLRLLKKAIDWLNVEREDDFEDQVRALLRTNLLTGHGSADQVAELFSMSRRTLNRQLSRTRTSFRALTEEVRFEIARQLLHDSSMEIVAIAAVLGYSSASAFTRAFRRWSGTTPARWRRGVQDTR